MTDLFESHDCVTDNVFTAGSICITSSWGMAPYAPRIAGLRRPGRPQIRGVEHAPIGARGEENTNHAIKRVTATQRRYHRKRCWKSAEGAPLHKLKVACGSGLFRCTRGGSSWGVKVAGDASTPSGEGPARSRLGVAVEASERPGADCRASSCHDRIPSTDCSGNRFQYSLPRFPGRDCAVGYGIPDDSWESETCSRSPRRRPSVSWRRCSRASM
jgi:hypothetical protein